MKYDLNGVLLLDKPVGLTSNDALQVVKKLFKANKVGHTGSLDPTASGMLPLCFGEVTKFSQFLLGADKRYLVTGKLGEITASGDSETPIIEKREVKDFSLKDLEVVLAKFRGKISQVPPMYSAIKYKGQPLYKLARQGIEIERSSRELTIHDLQLIELKDNLIKLDIHCSKGTYVRTLITDIGEALECGAHVVCLRRLEVGPYKATQMVALDTLQELVTKNDIQELHRLLLPVETMLVSMPEVTLTGDMVYYTLSGHPILVPNSPNSGWVKLKNKDHKFLGVGEVMADGRIAPRKLIKIHR